MDVIACNKSRTNNTQELVVTTEILQRSIISRTVVSELNDYKHSELSGKDKDLVLEYWHFVEDHLDEVNLYRNSNCKKRNKSINQTKCNYVCNMLKAFI